MTIAALEEFWCAAPVRVELQVLQGAKEQEKVGTTLYVIENNTKLFINSKNKLLFLKNTKLEFSGAKSTAELTFD